MRCHRKSAERGRPGIMGCMGRSRQVWREGSEREREREGVKVLLSTQFSSHYFSPAPPISLLLSFSLFPACGEWHEMPWQLGLGGRLGHRVAQESLLVNAWLVLVSATGYRDTLWRVREAEGSGKRKGNCSFLSASESLILLSFSADSRQVQRETFHWGGRRSKLGDCHRLWLAATGRTDGARFRSNLDTARRTRPMECRSKRES